MEESVLIDGNITRMQIDTGASVSVNSSKMWKAWNKPPLTKSQKCLEAYEELEMTTLGKFAAVLERENILYPIDLVVVEKKLQLAWARHTRKVQSKNQLLSPICIWSHCRLEMELRRTYS